MPSLLVVIRGTARRFAGASGPRWIARTGSFSASAAACPMTWASSRMLPGQRQASSARRASRVEPAAAGVQPGRLLEQPAGQGHDVDLPIAQRWQLEGDGVDALEEVRAEGAAVDQVLEVDRGGAHDAHVHPVGPLVADGAHRLLLEHPQEPPLQGRGQRADLVEEQRAAFGQSERAEAVLDRARERTAAVAEQLRLGQALGQPAQVEGHEGSGASARRMERAGELFLAGADLAADQHRHRPAGHPLGAPEQRHERGTHPHEVGECGVGRARAAGGAVVGVGGRWRETGSEALPQVVALLVVELVDLVEEQPLARPRTLGRAAVHVGHRAALHLAVGPAGEGALAGPGGSCEVDHRRAPAVGAQAAAELDERGVHVDHVGAVERIEAPGQAVGDDHGLPLALDEQVHATGAGPGPERAQVAAGIPRAQVEPAPGRHGHGPVHRAARHLAGEAAGLHVDQGHPGAALGQGLAVHPAHQGHRGEPLQRGHGGDPLAEELAEDLVDPGWRGREPGPGVLRGARPGLYRGRHGRGVVWHDPCDSTGWRVP